MNVRLIFNKRELKEKGIKIVKSEVASDYGGTHDLTFPDGMNWPVIVKSQKIIFNVTSIRQLDNILLKLPNGLHYKIRGEGSIS